MPPIGGTNTTKKPQRAFFLTELKSRWAMFTIAHNVGMKRSKKTSNNVGKLMGYS
jgi:hypothetical protein